MKLNEYQDKAKETLIKHGPAIDLAHLALGLNGEAGEVAEKVKKVLRDKGGKYTVADLKAIKDELGDVLWHVALMAEYCGYTLEFVANSNLNKLESRRMRGKIHGSGDNR